MKNFTFILRYKNNKFYKKSSYFRKLSIKICLNKYCIIITKNFMCYNIIIIDIFLFSKEKWLRVILIIIFILLIKIACYKNFCPIEIKIYLLIFVLLIFADSRWTRTFFSITFFIILILNYIILFLELWFSKWKKIVHTLTLSKDTLI